MNIFQIDSEFKKNVGDFILTFSEIEFSLGVIFSKLEVGTDINPLNPKYFGASFEEKRKKLLEKKRKEAEKIIAERDLQDITADEMFS